MKPAEKPCYGNASELINRGFVATQPHKSDHSPGAPAGSGSARNNAGMAAGTTASSRTAGSETRAIETNDPQVTVPPMRKKKLAKRLGITAGVLALLLVGAEVGAQYYAERELASRVREQLKLPHDPHVDIQGLLIPQAVTSDFRQISLAADPVALSKFQQLGVQAELHHTRLPISDVLSGKINEINVDRLDASVRLSESDLGRLFGIGDLKIRPASPQDLDPSEATPTSQGGSTAPVDVTGSTNLAGQDLKVRIVGVLALEDGKLNINPKRLQLQTQRFGVISLPPMFERALMQRFNTTLDPKMLPFAITPTGVRAQEGGLIVEGQASNLVISQNGIRTR